MKKTASILILLILACGIAFAGFSVDSSTSYILPVYGLDFTSGENNVSKAFNPGFLQEIEGSYVFNDYARLGISAGFGINEFALDTTVKPYFIPVMINGTFTTPKIGELDFFAKAGAGGFVKIDTAGKVIYLGPAAQIALGAEVNVCKGLYLGITTKVIATFEITEKSTAMQLDYSPFSISARYEF